FVQDRATFSRVTLNLGLRWSYYDGTIPAQGNGGAEWGAACSACNQSFPEIKTPYSWNTLAPRTGIVVKLTEDGKTVAKASYSRYYESMYTTEFSAINGNSIQTGGVATYAWNGARNADGTVPASGLLNANGTVPTRIVPDPGPDQVRTTGDDRTITFYDVAPAYLGKDAIFHTNCGNNVSVDCTQRYKAVEMSVVKRMSNHWQMQGSYVWSQLDGQIVLDYTNPNNALDFVGKGRGTADQPHAF